MAKCRCHLPVSTLGKIMKIKLIRLAILKTHLSQTQDRFCAPTQDIGFINWFFDWVCRRSEIEAVNQTINQEIMCSQIDQSINLVSRMLWSRTKIFSVKSNGARCFLIFFGKFSMWIIERDSVWDNNITCCREMYLNQIFYSISCMSHHFNRHIPMVFLVFFKWHFFSKINFPLSFFRYSWPSDELRQLQSPNTRVTTSVFVTGQRGRWLLSLRLQRAARCERHRRRWGGYSAAGSESHPVRFHERLDRPAGPHSNRLWYPREGAPFLMKLPSV